MKLEIRRARANARANADFEFASKHHGPTYANRPPHDGHILSRDGYSDTCARCNWLRGLSTRVTNAKPSPRADKSIYSAWQSEKERQP
jgi:hypothetical protein